MVLALFLSFWQISLVVSVVFGAPTINAADSAVFEAFKLAKLRRDEIVLDLGCSDAKTLIIAAEKFGAKGIGVEISPFYFVKARLNAILSGQRGRIKIVFGDLKKKSELIKQSDVIYLYLFPKLLNKIERGIFKQLKPNARVVTVGFKFKNHKEKFQTRATNRGRKTEIYLYCV